MCERFWYVCLCVKPIDMAHALLESGRKSGTNKRESEAAFAGVLGQTARKHHTNVIG